MDYEKKYNEALERARELIAKWVGKNKDFYVEDYAYIFPELRESEDERIRKEIVGVIQKHYPNTPESYRWISWLEKQKEPKPSETPSASVIYTEQGEVLAEQKPAWSEEDEKMLKCCLIAINHYEKTCNIGDLLPTKFNIYGYLASVDKVKSWLKSLRPNKQD